LLAAFEENPFTMFSRPLGAKARGGFVV